MSKIRYFTGLDLGQSQEYTAFAVLEQTRMPNPLKPGRYLKHYDVRHLERFALGTAYTEVAAALAKRFDDPTLQGAVLAVDQTAVGDPVVRMLRRSGIAARIHPITITAGHSATYGDGGWLVPKKELVSTLQVLMQSRRLRVVPTLAEAPTLVKELMNFKMKVKLVADDTLTAWRDGVHDDLVLAVAIAAWEGQRYYDFDIYCGPCSPF
jgi:hypothetical protein